MVSLVKHIATVLNHFAGNKKFCIAYSGGIDSQVLLYVLARTRDKDSSLSIRAVHVNHGVSEFAEEWQNHCAEQARQLGIPFQAYRLKIIRKPGESFEAVAREQRYAILAENLGPDETLLTGHNADDQAETLILQLMRGSGVAGLAAMPVCKPFANSELLRPLLQISRAQIKAYALRHKLNWVEDESNQNLGFDRNYVRHRVLPVLENRWQQAVEMLNRSAENCASTLALLQDVAQADLHQVMNDDQSVSIPKLLQLSQLRQENLIRYWVQAHNFQLPSKAQLAELFKTVIAADSDKTPILRWGAQEVRRYQQSLYLLDYTDFCFESYDGEWDLTQEFELPAGLGVLKAVSSDQGGLDKAKVKDNVQVRFRRGGETIKPSGRRETHRLKNLMQEWGIPPWQRDRTPLLFYQGQLIAVVGFCIAEELAESNASSIKIILISG